jgi:hypothetical protein
VTQRQVLARRSCTTCSGPALLLRPANSTVRPVRIVLFRPPVLAISPVTIGITDSGNQFLLTDLSLVIHNVAPSVACWPRVSIPQVGIVGLRRSTFDTRRAGVGVTATCATLSIDGPIALWAALEYSGFVIAPAFASAARERQALPAVYTTWLHLSHSSGPAADRPFVRARL